jgi:hypothetical protein
MSQRTLVSILVVIGLSVLGCSTGKVVTKPSDITLESAMTSVGAGLKAMKEAEGGTRTGLVPSEVTVAFNVTVSASDSKKLAVSASTVPATPLPVSGGVTGELGTSVSAARGNVITIKFTNVLFADEKQLVAKKTSEDINKILTMLKEQGVILFK